MTRIHRPFTDKKGIYAYSSVQLNLPEVIADEVINWGHKNIKESDLFIPEDDYVHGREEEPHVTVLYGIHDALPTESNKLLEGKSAFEVQLKYITLFKDNAYFDVVKIDVSSNSLTHMNNLLKSKLENTQNFHSYHPHVTIAYVKKGKCSDLNLDGTFNGIKWKVNSLIFSSKEGSKTPIRLSC